MSKCTTMLNTISSGKLSILLRSTTQTQQHTQHKQNTALGLMLTGANGCRAFMNIIAIFPQHRHLLFGASAVLPSYSHTLTRSHAHTLTRSHFFPGKRTRNETQTQTHTDTHTHTHIQTHTHTETQRHIQTDTHTDRQTKGKTWPPSFRRRC